MVFWVVLVVVVVGLFVVAAASSRAKDRALRAAEAGSVRVEAVKAGRVGNTVAQYAKAGWAVTEQSSAKSFGSQARVTITFRKS